MFGVSTPGVDTVFSLNGLFAVCARVDTADMLLISPCLFGFDKTGYPPPLKEGATAPTRQNIKSLGGGLSAHRVSPTKVASTHLPDGGNGQMQIVSYFEWADEVWKHLPVHGTRRQQRLPWCPSASVEASSARLSVLLPAKAPAKSPSKSPATASTKAPAKSPAKTTPKKRALKVTPPTPVIASPEIATRVQPPRNARRPAESVDIPAANDQMDSEDEYDYRLEEDEGESDAEDTSEGSASEDE
ncbi:unnamed protein product [Phytophthora fragariaefolia]|uniref:Unnamed protein product n=1 Tax=Phytophthora fragariaefolia TaxID=1490495 RepID=A0A9W6TNG8_9STRA|nr:unnamed protein product [Phytophthora fragariaefolia]